MPGTLGEVIAKIKDRLGDKMEADGIALDLLQRKKGREPHHPNSKAPWEIIYQWLWEIEFPRRGWELAKEMATSAMAELQMIDPKKVDRDLVFNVANGDDSQRGRICLTGGFPASGSFALD